jgi:hypothetical protein
VPTLHVSSAKVFPFSPLTLSLAPQGERGIKGGTSAKPPHSPVFLRSKVCSSPCSETNRDYYIIEARGPENLPPAPLKQCDWKGRDVGVAVPPGCGRREPCRKAWLLFSFRQAERPACYKNCHSEASQETCIANSFRLNYNHNHEKSRPARQAAFRQPSIRRRRMVVRRARPVGFGTGGAKEDVAAITRDPHYRNSQAGPIAALFFLWVARNGRPGR